MSMSPFATLDSLTYYFTAGSPATRPVAWEVSLHTGDPGSDGSANEVADAGYAREPATFATDNTDPDLPFADNTGLIQFGAAVTGYTASYVVVWSGAGNPLSIQRLVADKVIGVGVQAEFAVGELIIGGAQ